MKKLTACKPLKVWILAICLLNVTACGTISRLAEQDYQVYGGVSRDFALIQQGGVLSILAVIDLPLSFVFDTLLLPVTLTR